MASAPRRASLCRLQRRKLAHGKSHGLVVGRNIAFQLSVFHRGKNLSKARTGAESGGDEIVSVDERRGVRGPGRNRRQPLAGVVVKFKVGVAGKAIEAMQLQVLV